MSGYLKYEWRTRDGGTQIAFTFEGNVVDATAAIGRLIQQFYDKIDDRAKPAFRFACTRLMDDDSLVWRPKDEETVVIDLKALKKTLEGRGDQA